MGTVTSVQQLFVVRLLQGPFPASRPWPWRWPHGGTPDRFPAAIGMVQSAQLLSAAIGPSVRGYAASHLGIRYAFFVTAGMCASRRRRRLRTVRSPYLFIRSAAALPAKLPCLPGNVCSART